MAEIQSFLFVRHVQVEPTAHLLAFKDGRLEKSGRGASLWFLPLGTSLVEIPLDDRELAFVVRARTRDYQDVAVTGVLLWRVVEPEVLAARVDFTIDPKSGVYEKEPLEKIELVLHELLVEIANERLADESLREALESGVERVRDAMQAGLAADRSLTGMGLAVVAVRVSSVKPEPEVERALQVPAREAIQQRADEATFARRAQAVEKERAIQENELQNKIELAKQAETLVAQEGQNERRRAQEEALAKDIEATAAAQRKRTDADAGAAAIAVLEDAKVKAERDRMDVYASMPPSALMGLAARELAQKLTKIEHLNLSGDAFGPMLQRLLTAGADVLERRDDETKR